MCARVSVCVCARVCVGGGGGGGVGGGAMNAITCYTSICLKWVNGDTSCRYRTPTRVQKCNKIFTAGTAV